MKDFKANFEFASGKINIENGVANGSSVKLIVNGNIDVNNKQIDIKGQFIPSVFGLNRIISSIPVLGKTLLGKDGAVIAATFKVNGAYSDPKTSVNPLSLLAPGFLRQIFE